MLLIKLLVEGKTYTTEGAQGYYHCFGIDMALFCHCYGIVFCIVNFRACKFYAVFEDCANWHVAKCKG